MTANSSPAPLNPGVDLADPAVRRMARRILLRRHGGALARAGLDLEDVEQVLYETLLRRNSSPRGRWDPSRGGLSTYLFQVCRSVSSHALEALSNRLKHEEGSSGGPVRPSEEPSEEAIDRIQVAETVAEIEKEQEEEANRGTIFEVFPG